jgi:hypothetical protein
MEINNERNNPPTYHVEFSQEEFLELDKIFNEYQSVLEERSYEIGTNNELNVSVVNFLSGKMLKISELRKKVILGRRW